MNIAQHSISSDKLGPVLLSASASAKSDKIENCNTQVACCTI